MRVVPALGLGLSAALSLLMSGCRQQTAVDVDISTDVDCRTKPMSTGIQLGELTGGILEGDAPQVVTSACTPGAPGQANRVGDIMVTATAGNDSASFRLVVMANLRTSGAGATEAISAEQCSTQNPFDCIVARRTLSFVPQEGLTLPIFLQNECAGRVCEEGKTCVADPQLGARCVSDMVDLPRDCAAKSSGCAYSSPTATPGDPEAPEAPKATDGLPIVYASTADKLLMLDALSLEGNLSKFQSVSFKGCTGGVDDIAVTQARQIYALAGNTLYAVAPDGTCTPRGAAMPDIWMVGYPDTLAVMPRGVIPGLMGDVLVGQYTDGYIAINPLSGELKTITHPTGSLNASGDVVVVKAADSTVKAYISALAEKGAINANDELVEIDPQTGNAVKLLGDFTMKEVEGLAFAEGYFYGFGHNGTIVKMDTSGNVLHTIPTQYAFMGAASPASPFSP